MTLDISSSEHKNGDDITAGNLNAPHNEIVNYINNNIEPARYIDSNVTKTVGSGGDFGKLQDAIDYFGTLIPTKSLIGGIIKLKSGFVLDEYIYLKSKQLGWVNIEAEDPVVYVNPNAAYETETLGGPPRYQSILVFDSTFPTITFSLEAQSHNLSGYRLLTLSDRSTVTIIKNNAVRNNHGQPNNFSIALFRQSTLFAPASTFDIITSNEDSYAYLYGANFERVRVLRFSRADVSDATYNSVNVPLNQITPEGIIVDRFA